MTIEIDLPADLPPFRLPDAVAARLQSLLDRQDSGQPLTTQEREELRALIDNLDHKSKPKGERR